MLSTIYAQRILPCSSPKPDSAQACAASVRCRIRHPGYDLCSPAVSHFATPFASLPGCRKHLESGMRTSWVKYFNQFRLADRITISDRDSNMSGLMTSTR
uniref:Uncharacterized protein n=1 Tax=Craspedostauros australis TaxID=1486917 RepID=A0A7R9WRE4_9STRA